MSCSVCGRELPEDARFCPACGTPVASSLGTEERKMVTVVFVDLVDSTGLAQRLDPERAREVLGRFYDAASEELMTLRGQPEKFIGDAVMAVFGLPQVHEDDAVRAIRAGFAIRGRVGRLSAELGLDEPLGIRVGVESGEAATGVGPSGQSLATGPVVNAAARLQAAASPGEILVGETAHALTEGSVAVGERREVEAKGFAGGLSAYPAEGLSTRSARRTIPFVGRADELTILRQTHARAVATERPILFTVLGEPGIGKSRLTDEFIAGVDPDETVLVGRSSLAAESATFAPAASMMRDAAGIGDDDLPETAERRVRELAERIAPPGEAERLGERLLLLLGLDGERREEAVFVQEVQAGFVTTVEGLARERPVTLVFDDAHTFGGPMLDLVERVATRGTPGPGRVLVLVAARPPLLDERDAWGAHAVNHVLLRLEPLSSVESVSLARQAGGGRIEEHDAADVAERAGGNPFFIVESTGMLIRDREHGRRERRGLPPTVQAMVAARLDELPPVQRELARRLSVYLYSFDRAEAELVAPDCSDAALHDLIDAEIVVQDDPRTTTRWRFRHETLRDVAYASLPKRERLALHVTIADALEAQDRDAWAAEHLEAAALASLDLDPNDRTLPERAAAALARSGDRARRRMDNRSAVDAFQRALAMAGPEQTWTEREAQVLSGMGEARYWLGEYPASKDAMQRALALAERVDDDRARSRALRFLGDMAINVDADLDHAEALLDRALEAAERLGDTRAITRTLLFAGWVPWTREEYQRADPIWRRALELARGDDDRWAEIRALTSLSINCEHLDEFEEATLLIEEAQALADETGDRFSVAVTATQRGRIEEDLGRFEEALPHLERAIAIFSELGARWELGDALAERGIVERELGLLDEAEQDLRHAVRISEEIGERQLASWTWRALAKVADRRGDEAEAAERWRRAEEEEARRPR
ncbi:MAG: tetratricopeptide repeat protein [Actinomycetota bacterium]